MKRFIITLILFSIPLIAFLSVILCFPMDKRFAYAYTGKDSYTRSLWIYDRINNNSTPIDVAFIGTSRTIHAINDSVLQKQLLTVYSIKTHLANLGYYRFGRNMNYVIIKELLKKRTVKTIVLEVTSDEDISSNLDFGYMADLIDVIYPAHINQVYFSDLCKSFNVHLSYIKYKLNLENDTINCVLPQIYGYGNSTQLANLNDLKHMDRYPVTNYFGRWPNILYPRAYLNKIAELCKANNVKLYFLYIAGYTTYSRPPLELDTYKKYGQVFLPPYTISDHAENFMDEAHMNNTGADKMTDYLLTHPELFR